MQRLLFNIKSRREIVACCLFLIPGLMLTYQSDVYAGQGLINDLCLGAEIHYGAVLPHSASIKYSVEESINRIELTLSTSTYGRNAWDRRYRYPRLGTGYLFTSLGNNAIYGHAHALFLYMDIPLALKERKFSAWYQISFGAAYLDKVYSVNENPLNMAISSGLNLYGCFNVNAKYRMTDRSELRAGIGFSHFSNGKLSTPNLGINSLTISAGYNYRLSGNKYKRETSESPLQLNKHQSEVIFSFGTKTDDQVTGVYYLISSFVAEYKYVPGIKYSCGIGTDFFYDESLGPNKSADEGGTYSRADLFQFGLHGAFYPRFSRLTIIIQLGTYIHANYYKYSRVYSRIGMRFEVLPNVLINFSLKSHYAIADYLEWGIGYRINGGRVKYD
jgi:hypothetical protein